MNVRSTWKDKGWEGNLTFLETKGGNMVLRIAAGGVVFPNPSGGTDYYVDANSGSDTLNTGLGWLSPYATLAKAFTVSQVAIASGSTMWAARNRIFIKGDPLTEDLVKFAGKTDVIGVGSVDGLGPARIYGNHAPATTDWMGCRFINVDFLDKAGGAIMTIATLQSGIGFIGCGFLTGASTTIGITSTASTDLTIKDCHFNGSWNTAFSAEAIYLGTGSANRTLIEGNTIEGAVAGIVVHSGRTGAGSFVRGNFIQTTSGKCINDASSTLYIIGNRGITGAAKGSSLAGAVVGSTHLAGDNNFTCSDADNIIWPANGTI